MGYLTFGEGTLSFPATRVEDILGAVASVNTHWADRHEDTLEGLLRECLGFESVIPVNEPDVNHPDLTQVAYEVIFSGKPDEALTQGLAVLAAAGVSGQVAFMGAEGERWDITLADGIADERQY